jgi:hypothetical protein
VALRRPYPRPPDRSNTTIYRSSTALYRASTAAGEGARMFNPARLVAAAVVSETVDRGFDWGSAAVGAGAGAALTLLLLALAASVRSARRRAAHYRGGRRA